MKHFNILAKYLVFNFFLESYLPTASSKFSIISFNWMKSGAVLSYFIANIISYYLENNPLKYSNSYSCFSCCSFYGKGLAFLDLLEFLLSLCYSIVFFEDSILKAIELLISPPLIGNKNGKKSKMELWKYLPTTIIWIEISKNKF